jgi:hypothetical protein
MKAFAARPRDAEDTRQLPCPVASYVADDGTLLFDDVPKSYRHDLVSSTASSAGGRQAAVPAAPYNRGGCAPSPSSPGQKTREV